jgi:hypothetical protein
MINARDIDLFLAGAQFPPSKVDAASRARVIVFQSWLGVSDEQVLIDLDNGRILSFDHGDSFGSIGVRGEQIPDPIPIVTAIGGVPDSVGRSPDVTLAAVSSVESFTDQQLLLAVSCIPDDTLWNGGTARRLRIAEWLAYRRERIREVMQAWL